MATPPRDEEPEEAGKPNKGKFFFADDGDSDEDEMQGFLALKKATYDDTQEEDIIDQTIRQELEKCQNPSLGASDHAQAGLQSPDEEFSELFVSPNEECQVDNSPSKPQLNVEADPASDDDFMIIDATEASADAQEKWAVPRDFVVDLTKVKQEPQRKARLPDSPRVKRSASEEVSIAAVPRHKQDGAGIETLEKEKAELTDKALRGALSPDELSQLLQITAQLNDAKGSNIPHQADDAKQPINEKAKKPRKVTTKEEYWAKQAENERKKKQELRENGRKRTGKNKTAQTKKVKTSLTSAKPQGDGDSSDEDDQEALGEIERQIAEMLRPLDAILERSQQGDLPTEPDIRATRKEDQLRQMRNAAPEYFEKELLEKQEKELRDSTKAWGPWGVRPKNGKWEVRRVLINPLHNHQIVVGAWMMGRELKNTPRLPRGGILADAMGLGKTIETLSCISGNPSSDRLKDKGQGATLVVCPSQQMIGVWMSEVNKHCGKRFARDMVQYKRQNKMSIDLLGSFNIVLATYHQVRASIPSIKEQQEMQKELVDTEKYKEWLAENTGDLHRIKWYRVVLDEAHSIKNHLTHGAFACFELQSKYRWVVSGTPLINSHFGK
ncbi:SNF2 family domain-containing protein [Colletotrichum sp. SAR 10_70]|nr:SNF2 family domain-containing protein [Colletotrichum sp. SAR 10_71]KAI8169350.1 SNF2 family domain-containing protein [Colletotrichum sp. SAR 10_70]KAI8177148.1 SNF2 family domain-containing protein [Colletotrichum sp. SAR 10_75]KAI8203518.1 SNF2 family domain-containing protein [Colletotrichum sp. SAR 10_65]KAI8237820.1 SNF2 family domain-containing protein [Colletotrichum sp. SAR 10_86]KAI8250260.1 SNF2 family domain-containing protein [Colletotrichum sp. SAR 10_77]KAJ4998842.1 SNF2 fam